MSYVMKSITSISHLRWLFSPPWCLTAPPCPVGRWWHQPSHQRGNRPRPQGGCKGCIIRGRLLSKSAPPRPLPPERSEHNPWHRGPTGPMDAICSSAPKARAPAGIQESTSPPTGIYREMIHYRRVPRSFALWRPCRGSPSQPKLALSLHIKGPSDCRLTDPG